VPYGFGAAFAAAAHVVTSAAAELFFVAVAVVVVAVAVAVAEFFASEPHDVSDAQSSAVSATTVVRAAVTLNG